MQDVDYYMALPYTVKIERIEDEDDVYYFARVVELDGCMAHGDTEEEARESLREAMRGYIEVKLEYGDPIPEPKEESE